MGWIWTLIVGAIIGAIAGAITSKGNSMGCITNIIAGLIVIIWSIVKTNLKLVCLNYFLFLLSLLRNFVLSTLKERKFAIIEKREQRKREFHL